MLPDQASRTALLIARSLDFTSRDGTLGELVWPESVEIARAIVRARPRGRGRVERWFIEGGGRPLIALLEAAVLPGMQLHYVLRKRFIGEVVEEAIGQGVRQLVVVGAGLDALALRVSRRPERLLCIEVDHPATQALKAEALSRLDAPSGNLILAPADLSRVPLEEALASVGYDPSEPTCFVAEGVTMYLDEQSVTRLLRTCAEHSPRGSRLAWTFMEPDAEGRLAFRGSRRRIVDRWLRSRGESFTWGIERDRVAGFVAELGWEVMQLAGAAELRTRYLSGRPEDLALAAGEMICVIRRP